MVVSILKRVWESPSAQFRARQAENALFGKASAPVDVEIAEAVARLTEAFCKTDAPGVFDGISFFFAKIKDDDGAFRIYAKRLSVDDRKKLDAAQDLLDSPEQAIQTLGLKKIAD